MIAKHIFFFLNDVIIANTVRESLRGYSPLKELSLL